LSRQKVNPRSGSGLQLAPKLAAGLRFEPFRIAGRVDAEKRYRLTLEPSFPLAVRLFEFPAAPGAIPMTWHERLEIFCPLTGPGQFRIGEQLEAFEAGDILLVDNLRLHGVEGFSGRDGRALVVVFYPELVAAPGAPPCDLWLLRPFRHLRGGCLRLPAADKRSVSAWNSLSRLVMEQTGGDGGPASQARQKLALNELLLLLEEAFRDRIEERSDYEGRRDRLRRLSPLVDFLTANPAEPLRVPAAARMLRMSPSYFMRFFRNATGLTFASYVDHLRVSKAYQLLTESDLSLAQIAEETGFCDQCHLNRQIRRRFGTSPGRLRARHRAAAG
jgi:AraC-like DNA-binding protein